jgi:hypothetical protein
MKNLSLYLIALATISSFSLQAMHECFSSTPLNRIERKLIKEAIKHYGLESIRNSINKHKNSHFFIDCVLHKNEAQTDPFTKKIFDEIEKIENKPENKGNLPTKTNYFSFRSWYHRDWRNLDIVYVTMKSCNIKELNEICDSYKE